MARSRLSSPSSRSRGQRADRVDAVGVGLRLGPLLVVGELGAAPLELVEILVALPLDLGELVVGRRGRGLAVGAVSAGRRWLSARVRRRSLSW